MNLPVFSLNELLVKENREVVKQVIEQLNKDLTLSGNDLQIKLNASPKQLIENLSAFVAHSLNSSPENLSNFLYRADIPESKIAQILQGSVEEIPQKVTLLILQKEWTKVWLRNKS